MLPYVNTLLVAWGKWVVRQQDGGVGWPTRSAMFRDAPAGTAAQVSKPPVGVGYGAGECEETDAAIRRMNEADRLLAREVYVVGGTTKAIAERLGWHRQRVPERISAMHQRLLGHINDVAAGC